MCATCDGWMVETLKRVRQNPIKIEFKKGKNDDLGLSSSVSLRSAVKLQFFSLLFLLD